MNEVVSGLWIGDLRSALNTQMLKANSIFSVLTAMRGRITVHETFIRHQIQLDDTEDADILTHFLPSIHFIQAELNKGRGVLVHCQAGISRSSTIVAAYLMYSRGIDPEAALALIREVRPFVDPNVGFLEQLQLFHQAQYRISKREKAVRMFYLDRTVGEVMNGDGSPPETEMFAKYPRSPSDSVPNTPGPRRRIRCKMCRQELATREHMLDHGQLGPPTPASITPAVSRRSSSSTVGNSFDQTRQQSHLSISNLGDTLSMASIQEDSATESEANQNKSSAESAIGVSRVHPLESLRSMSQQLLDTSSMSALDTEDDGESGTECRTLATSSPPTRIDLSGVTAEDITIEASQAVGRRLSEAILTTTDDSTKSVGEDEANSYFAANGASVKEYTTATKTPESAIKPQTTQLFSPVNLAAQLFADPKLTALRSPTTANIQQNVLKSPLIVSSPPILANPKCSGYFTEPMKWMDDFISAGQVGGKIMCPNKRCGAKLGNYDWAGMRCGCNEWVVPAFCINRSKVDEVV